MKSLPIPIARCPRGYAEMTPLGPRSRHCAECDKAVHDLSSMSRAEAATLLARDDGLCVRYLHDGKGGVVHRGRTKRALAIAAMVAAPLLIEACGGAPRSYDYYPEQVLEEEREPTESGPDEAAEPSEEEASERESPER